MVGILIFHFPLTPFLIGQQQPFVPPSNSGSGKPTNSDPLLKGLDLKPPKIGDSFNPSQGLDTQTQPENGVGSGINLSEFGRRLPLGSSTLVKQKDGSYSRVFDRNIADNTSYWIQGDSLYAEGPEGGNGTVSIDNGTGGVTTQTVTRGVYYLSGENGVGHRNEEILSWTKPLAGIGATPSNNGSAHYVDGVGLAHYLVLNESGQSSGRIWRADGQLYVNGSWTPCATAPTGTMFVGTASADGRWIMPGANPNEPPFYLAGNEKTIIRYKGLGNNLTVQQYNQSNNSWSNLNLTSVSDINLYRQVVHALLPNASQGTNNTTQLTLSNGQTIQLSYSNIGDKSTVTIADVNPQTVFNNLNQADHQIFQMLISQCNLQIRVGSNNYTLQAWAGSNNDERSELRYQYQSNGQTTVCSRYAVVGDGNNINYHQIVHLHNWLYTSLPQHTAPVYGYKSNGQNVEWDHDPISVVRNGTTYTLAHSNGQFRLVNGNQNIPYNTPPPALPPEPIEINTKLYLGVRNQAMYCHDGFRDKNEGGFKLSLYGFDPNKDFDREALLRDIPGRRNKPPVKVDDDTRKIIDEWLKNSSKK